MVATGKTAMPTWLSISGGKLDEKCEGVVRALAKVGVGGDVTPNRSVTKDGVEEKGCRVLVLGTDTDVQRVWKTVKVEEGLQCAHVSTVNVQSGCVYDVYGSTRCPDCYVKTAMEDVTM